MGFLRTMQVANERLHNGNASYEEVLFGLINAAKQTGDQNKCKEVMTFIPRDGRVVDYEKDLSRIHDYAKSELIDSFEKQRTI